MDEPIPTFASVEEELAFWKAQQLETSTRLAEERDRKAKEAAEAEAQRAEYLMHVRTGAISIHKCVGHFLELRGGWGRTANADQKCDLFLAAWCGGGVEWGALGSSGSAHASQRMLTNYYRGYQMLCFKDTCALNLQVRWSLRVRRVLRKMEAWVVCARQLAVGADGWVHRLHGA
jgi:hypothetical protein